MQSSIAKSGFVRKGVVVLALAATLSACADMTPRQQRALSGGAIGAAGGAAVGLMTGGLVTGALIGGAGGAAIGALLPDDFGKKQGK